MKNGDIILQIGDKTVRDIQDYMKCLSELNAGETVSLKIRRGDEIRTLIINL
jgi:S1-C subfamily serine protease